MLWTVKGRRRNRPRGGVVDGAVADEHFQIIVPIRRGYRVLNERMLVLACRNRRWTRGELEGRNAPAPLLINRRFRQTSSWGTGNRPVCVGAEPPGLRNG